LDPDNVVYISTLSKIFAPGLRLGYCLPPKRLRPWLVRVKQGNDLHTSTFNQALGAEYLAGGHMARHLPKIIALYKPRQEAMLKALAAYFPDGFRWSNPEGGMFIWVEGPSDINVHQIYRDALTQGIAFVPGEHFFAIPRQGSATMRLNYTMADEMQIDRAIKTLALVINRSDT
jgi:2-aminoadipate transaminase